MIPTAKQNLLNMKSATFSPSVFMSWSPNAIAMARQSGLLLAIIRAKFFLHEDTGVVARLLLVVGLVAVGADGVCATDSWEAMVGTGVGTGLRRLPPDCRYVAPW